MHAYIYAYIYRVTDANMLTTWECIHTYTYKHTHTHTHTYTYAHTRTYTHTYRSWQVSCRQEHATHMYSYTYTYAHIHMYKDTYHQGHPEKLTLTCVTYIHTYISIQVITLVLKEMKTSPKRGCRVCLRFMSGRCEHAQMTPQGYEDMLREGGQVRHLIFRDEEDGRTDGRTDREIPLLLLE